MFSSTQNEVVPSIPTGSVDDHVFPRDLQTSRSHVLASLPPRPFHLRHSYHFHSDNAIFRCYHRSNAATSSGSRRGPIITSSSIEPLGIGISEGRRRFDRRCRWSEGRNVGILHGKWRRRWEDRRWTTTPRYHDPHRRVSSQSSPSMDTCRAASSEGILASQSVLRPTGLARARHAPDVGTHGHGCCLAPMPHPPLPKRHVAAGPARTSSTRWRFMISMENGTSMPRYRIFPRRLEILGGILQMTCLSDRTEAAWHLRGSQHLPPWATPSPGSRQLVAGQREADVSCSMGASFDCVG